MEAFAPKIFHAAPVLACRRINRRFMAFPIAISPDFCFICLMIAA
jgi:hypothetical protein